MPYYIQYFNYRYIHWACESCLVRSICNENCHRTKYKHPLCEPCDNGCSSYPCPKVERSLLFDRVYRAYGEQMMQESIKHMQKTSLARFMKPSEETFH